jgi:hypothetical protein
LDFLSREAKQFRIQAVDPAAVEDIDARLCAAAHAVAPME